MPPSRTASAGNASATALSRTPISWSACEALSIPVPDSSCARTTRLCSSSLKIRCPWLRRLPTSAKDSSMREETSAIEVTAAANVSVVSVEIVTASTRRCDLAGLVPERDLARDQAQRHALFRGAPGNRFLGHAEDDGALLI